MPDGDAPGGACLCLSVLFARLDRPPLAARTALLALGVEPVLFFVLLLLLLSAQCQLLELGVEPLALVAQNRIGLRGADCFAHARAALLLLGALALGDGGRSGQGASVHRLVAGVGRGIDGAAVELLLFRAAGGRGAAARALQLRGLHRLPCFVDVICRGELLRDFVEAVNHRFERFVARATSLRFGHPVGQCLYRLLQRLVAPNFRGIRGVATGDSLIIGLHFRQ